MSHISPAFETSPAETAPRTSLVTTALAAALAVLIGLSAADIHRGDRPETGQSVSWERDGRQLDGRGKWAGYLHP